MPRRQVPRRCETYVQGEEASAACVLGADELEALRLSDLLEMPQTEAARHMGVSQSTFQRILTAAHRKVATCLLERRPLTIAQAWDASWNEAGASRYHKKSTGGSCMTMHIALPTDDGTTIAHLGRARYYKVVEITDGKVTSAELRDKYAHVCHDRAEAGESLTHDDIHRRMADAAHGCDAVIVGNIGQGALEALKSAGLQVIHTDLVNLDEIVVAYAAETLPQTEATPCCRHHEGDAHDCC